MNWLEVFNEFLATVLCYHLVIFTDFYTDFEVRYKVGGQSLIYTTVLIIAVNMMNVLFAFFLELRKFYLKQLAILRRRNEIRRKLEEEIAAKMKSKFKKKRKSLFGLPILTLSISSEEAEDDEKDKTEAASTNSKVKAKTKPTAFLTPKLKLITHNPAKEAKVNTEAGLAHYNSNSGSSSFISSSLSQSSERVTC
mmetsp:Transcript_22490/g.34778  ORF Transcript_22490/g.34778 Transcript_22490/m.34778 type:complete len:195 (+) Transcript_22490:58-642(+)